MNTRQQATIRYRSGYKYQLTQAYRIELDIRPQAPIITEYIRLDMKGKLRIAEAYAWDGPSGPVIDTKNFMRGSLVHDALYQLMREGRLSQDCREAADKMLRQIVREDGMSWLRAWWVYHGVRLGGGPAANPAAKRPPLEAP